MSVDQTTVPVPPVVPKGSSFVCPTCSKRFTRKDYLTRHELNHNDVKPFKCEQCNLSFTRSDLLAKHFRSKAHQRARTKIEGSSATIFNQTPKIITSHNNTLTNPSAKNTTDKITNLTTGATTKNTNKSRAKRLFDQSIHPISSYALFNNDLKSFTDPTSIGSFSPPASLSSSSLKSPSITDESEPQRKKFKRLGIANFLNDQDEKIHAPPPQPSIILPSLSLGATSSMIPGTNIHMNFTNRGDITPNNSQIDVGMNTLQGSSTSTSSTSSSSLTNQNPSGIPDKGINNHHRQYQPVHNAGDNGASRLQNFVFDSNNQQPNHLFPTPHNNNNSVFNAFSQTPDMAGGFIDNLLWLFSDVSPLTDGSINNSIGKSVAANSATNYNTPSMQSMERSNYFDLNPVVYKSPDNSSTESLVINIDNATRTSIINVFATVKEINNIPLSRFDDFLDLYWFNFAQTFPIIHRPTFNPNTVDIYLLISMLIIGMAYSLDKFEYELSITLNKKFRRIIKDVVDETIELPLPIIQSLVLHNFSAKNYGDIKLTQLALIDHGSNILYLKFSGMLDTLTEPAVYQTSACSEKEISDRWHEWIYYETCKRTVFFEFICDTQHVTFSRLKLLSAFDIKLELPCTDEVWYAANPTKFFAEYQKQPQGLSDKLKVEMPMGRGYNAEITKDAENEKNPPHQNITQQNRRFPSKIGHESAEGGNNNKSNSITSTTTTTTTTTIINDIGNTTRPGQDHHASNSAATFTHSINMINKWPSFLWSLKSMMMEYKENQKDYSLNCYSLFSRYIILHGLMRTCWDMRSQGFLDLGVASKEKLNEFFKKLERAFLNWRGYFDFHMRLYDTQSRKKETRATTTTLSINNNSNNNIHDIDGPLSKSQANEINRVFLNNYSPTNGSWANLSFYYTGLFTLYADITAIKKFASECKSFYTKDRNSTYKDMNEMERESNQMHIRQWARSLNGELALVEASKFLTLVFKHEGTVNTFSHVPGTMYLAAIMIWCLETNRNCSSVPSLLTTSNDQPEKTEQKLCINSFPNYVAGHRVTKEGHDADYSRSFFNFNLNANKYFDIYGSVKHELACEDAVSYFEMVIDGPGCMAGSSRSPSCQQDDGTKQQGKKGDIDPVMIKRKRVCEDRQTKAPGVICYVLHLLRSCKWSYSIDLVQKLEYVIGIHADKQFQRNRAGQESIL
ncbi:hypothetical protein DASC09_022910 [Saccharomycopsis crataegensis]|uniref:C2H2-type domain-containing protein n=1 Tax=Saccharomycopsis crataegensis TaxID=43959 RepID=A0AAV5QK15_9ASCO|nr:hypothetical protein DASC09_022910 [Saccharomycopsis crataegensis]